MSPKSKRETLLVDPLDDTAAVAREEREILARWKRREQLPYDGLLGALPASFPLSEQVRFLDARNEMLDAVPHDGPRTVRSWLNARRRNDESGYPPAFEDLLATLIFLKGVADRPAEEHAALLGDSARIDVINNLARGRRAGRQALQDRAIAAHEDWKKRAISKWQIKPRAKAPDVAREIVEDLTRESAVAAPDLDNARAAHALPSWRTVLDVVSSLKPRAPKKAATKIYGS